MYTACASPSLMSTTKPCSAPIVLFDCVSVTTRSYLRIRSSGWRAGLSDSANLSDTEIGETYGYTSPAVLLLIKLLVNSAVAGQAANISHRWLHGLAAVPSRKTEDRAPARTHSLPELAYTFASKLCVVSVCAEAVNSSEAKATNSSAHGRRMPATLALLSRSGLLTALGASYCFHCDRQWPATAAEQPHPAPGRTQLLWQVEAERHYTGELEPSRPAAPAPSMHLLRASGAKQCSSR